MPLQRRCLLVVVAALPLTLVASPAAASTDSQKLDLVVDRSAWSWRKTLPLPVDEPSRVPEGGLAVAADGDAQGRPSKATYLRLDLAALTAGSRVDQLTVTLPLDPAAESSDSTSVRLVACRLLAPFSPGEGVDAAAMPEQDCTAAPAGRFDPEADGGAGAWSFALTALAQGWAANAASNHGFVVRPPADYLLPTDLPFQLSFAGPSKVRAELLADIPAVVEPAVPAPVAPAEPAAQLPALAAVAPPALDATVTAPIGLPAVALPAASPVTAPAQIALPAAPSAARAARVLPPARFSTGALWSLAALAGLLLVAVSRVAGNTAGPYALARLERARLDRLRLRVPVAAVELEVLPVQPPQRRQGRRPMSSATSTVT